MGLGNELQGVFGSSDLYAVLCADRRATQGQLKTAYYKASLKLHPDRVTEDEKEQATVRFQLLGKVYGVLGDEERRKVYDDTGDTGDDDLQERDWAAYWRLLFKHVTVQDIRDFRRKYQHSEDERRDLLQAYHDHNGDMGAIMEHVMCAEAEDEPRLRAILQNDALRALILGNQRKREEGLGQLFAGLEAKYAPKPKDPKPPKRHKK